uniref:Uncharacterized protein n=1 Tax=Anguilla anguilla TaxID=7936 RepID=A0A0E9PG01_ANGAN
MGVSRCRQVHVTQRRLKKKKNSYFNNTSKVFWPCDLSYDLIGAFLAQKETGGLSHCVVV